ncbi:MAG: UTP--glucose-1-phosphate uridylyltransferase [Candidatus Omnitrophica bacterium]|nr:UTP--glucose-1-phosphate uridylyltransferase [Candidatus Omnitrophota bacterium]
MVACRRSHMVNPVRERRHEAMCIDDENKSLFNLTKIFTTPLLRFAKQCIKVAFSNGVKVLIISITLIFALSSITPSVYAVPKAYDSETLAILDINEAKAQAIAETIAQYINQAAMNTSEQQEFLESFSPWLQGIWHNQEDEAWQKADANIEKYIGESSRSNLVQILKGLRHSPTIDSFIPIVVPPGVVEKPVTLSENEKLRLAIIVKELTRYVPVEELAIRPSFFENLSNGRLARLRVKDWKADAIEIDMDIDVLGNHLLAMSEIYHEYLEGKLRQILKKQNIKASDAEIQTIAAYKQLEFIAHFPIKRQRNFVRYLVSPENKIMTKGIKSFIYSYLRGGNVDKRIKIILYFSQLMEFMALFPENEHEKLRRVFLRPSNDPLYKRMQKYLDDYVEYLETVDENTKKIITYLREIKESEKEQFTFVKEQITLITEQLRCEYLQKRFGLIVDTRAMLKRFDSNKREKASFMYAMPTGMPADEYFQLAKSLLLEGGKEITRGDVIIAEHFLGRFLRLILMNKQFSYKQLNDSERDKFDSAVELIINTRELCIPRDVNDVEVVTVWEYVRDIIRNDGLIDNYKPGAENNAVVLTPDEVEKWVQGDENNPGDSVLYPVKEDEKFGAYVKTYTALPIDYEDAVQIFQSYNLPIDRIQKTAEGKARIHYEDLKRLGDELIKQGKAIAIMNAAGKGTRTERIIRFERDIDGKTVRTQRDQRGRGSEEMVLDGIYRSYIETFIASVNDTNKKYRINTPATICVSFMTKEALIQLVTDLEILEYQHGPNSYTYVKEGAPDIRLIFMRRTFLFDKMSGDLYRSRDLLLRTTLEGMWSDAHDGSFIEYYASGMAADDVDNNRKFVFISNVDNRVATIDPIIVAMMELTNVPLVNEVALKPEGEKGGTAGKSWEAIRRQGLDPAIVHGRSLFEGFELTPGLIDKMMQEDLVGYGEKFPLFNTANYVINIKRFSEQAFQIEDPEQLLEQFQAIARKKEAALRKNDEQKLKQYYEEYAEIKFKLLEWYRFLTQLWEEDKTYPALQPSNLAGTMTRIAKTLYIEVLTGADAGVYSRFQPRKYSAPNELRKVMILSKLGTTYEDYTVDDITELMKMKDDDFGLTPQEQMGFDFFKNEIEKDAAGITPAKALTIIQGLQLSGKVGGGEAVVHEARQLNKMLSDLGMSYYRFFKFSDLVCFEKEFKPKVFDKLKEKEAISEESYNELVTIVTNLKKYCTRIKVATYNAQKIIDTLDKSAEIVYEKGVNFEDFDKLHTVVSRFEDALLHPSDRAEQPLSLIITKESAQTLYQYAQTHDHTLMPDYLTILSENIKKTAVTVFVESEGLDSEVLTNVKTLFESLNIAVYDDLDKPEMSLSEIYEFALAFAKEKAANVRILGSEDRVHSFSKKEKFAEALYFTTSASNGQKNIPFAEVVILPHMFKTQEALKQVELFTWRGTNELVIDANYMMKKGIPLDHIGETLVRFLREAIEKITIEQQTIKIAA